MPSMRKLPFIPWDLDDSDMRLFYGSGCEPLTPADIAEVVVFTATRRENLVIADTLLFPNHQVRVMHDTIELRIPGTDISCFLLRRKASALIMHRKSN